MGTALVAVDENRACELAADGHSSAQVSRLLGVARTTFADYLARMPAFAAKFARARKLGGEAKADTLETIADTEPDLQRAKLKCDNIRWLLARTHREEYGDRVDVAVQVSVDLGAAMRDAKARALRPTSDPSDVVDAEYTAISAACDAAALDKESGAPQFDAIQAPSIFD